MMALDPRKSYDILENLIVQGFDVMGVRIGDVSLVLKTVSPREEKVMVYTEQGGVGISKNAYLAWATYMVDGESVLASRPSVLKDLRSFYAGLPGVVVSRLAEDLVSLQYRSQMASTLLVGFCLSPRSRSLWEVLGDHVNLTRFTGIEGTESLGLNNVQETWISYNKALDREEQNKVGMRHAVFVASAHNPKGVEKVTLSTESREKNQAEERLTTSLFGSMANRDAVLGIKKPDGVDGWAPRISTNKDLIRELEKQMRGEKDRHDLFVESYFRKMAEEEEAREALATAVRKETYKKLDPDSVFQGQASVSAEEMEMAMRGDIDIRDIVSGRERFGNSGHKVGHRVIRR